MRFGFFQKKKEMPFLVLDIGTEAIKSLVCKKENNKLVVLDSAEHCFEPYSIFDGRDLGNKVVKRGILKIIKQAYRNLPVLLSLSPDILKTRVAHCSFERNRGSKISKGEEKVIVQEIFKQAKEEISQGFAKESGILPKDIYWVSFKTLETKINGYLVSELCGCQGRDLDFQISAVFLPKDYFKNIQRIFENLGLKISKITTHYAQEIF